MELAKREIDRRGKHRFAIHREIRYKMAEPGVVAASGNGYTIDIGSGGVAFSTGGPLPPRAFVELSISWPVLLEESCPMRLVVFGRVLRTDGKLAVCTVEKYEFRTQSRKVQTGPAARTDGMLQRWAEGMRKGTLRANIAGV